MPVPPAPPPRQLAKWLLACLLHVTGVLRWLRWWHARRGDALVLAFHRVQGDERGHLPLAIPPSAFRALVDGLVRRCAVVGFQDCVSASARNVEPARGALRVVLSFDDGYADNATVAWPILREAGVKALFCPVTGFLDGEPLWWEVIAAGRGPGPGAPHPTNRWNEAQYAPKALAEIERLKGLAHAQVREQVAAELAAVPPHLLPRGLTWQQVASMVQQGAEVGAHGVSHPILPRCTDAELGAELSDCRRELEARTGESVTVLAYPNGAHDDRVVAAARRAGYQHGLTVERGFYNASCDPLRIPRVAVSEGTYSLRGDDFSWPLFEAEVLGVFEALRRVMRRAR